MDDLQWAVGQGRLLPGVQPGRGERILRSCRGEGDEQCGNEGRYMLPMYRAWRMNATDAAGRKGTFTRPNRVAGRDRLA